MRQELVKLLKPIGAMAVENRVLPGTPDVNYIEGWIELKWLRSWPVGADTVVRIEHFTPQQRVWHFRRRRAGGQSWFLLRCKREWLLLDGAVAALVVCHATRAQLIERAELYFSTGLEVPTLVDCLRRRQLPYSFTPEEISQLRDL
jgi:hypothetical protein